jgi:microcystin-dependent protein
MSNITKILFRRGLDSQRQTTVLQQGEPGYSIDTKRLFIGDGATTGGTPVSINNYGAISSLSGSFSYSGLQTNLSQTAFTLLSGAYIGDVVYDLATTSICSVSSLTVYGSSDFPLLSNFAHYNSSTSINSNQFYYNGQQLTIQNGQNGQGYGVGINELSNTVVAASQTLSGGSGLPLTLRTTSISNNYFVPGVNNSAKITDGNGNVNDVLINQNQILGRTNAIGSTLGAVTLSASGSLSLSATTNTLLFNIPFFLPLSGGNMTGGLSALAANSGRLTTDVAPVLPTDVINLSYISALSAITPSYLFSRFLTLSGGTLSGPGNLNVSGTAQFNNVGVTGSLSASSLTINGTISANQGLSATGVVTYLAPINQYDATNKAYTDSKFLPLSGGTVTGNISAGLTSRIYTSNTPAQPTEVANKGYVDSLQSYIGSSFLALSGGTVTGAVSSTNRFYSTNNPVASAELTTKNYVDTQVVNSSPVGCVAYFASSTPPSGWIKANGAVLPIASYQNLFNILPKQANGNTIWWVAGDGPTNFRLPDLRGQFIRGWNDGTSNGNTTNTGTNPTIPTTDAGRTFGTTQGDAYASHTHGVNDPGHSHGVNDPGHSHSYQGYSGGVGEGGNYPLAVEYNFVTNYTGGAGTGISISGAGTGIAIAAAGSNETRPTNVALLACIKY